VTCTDFQAQVDALALGMLEPAEAAAVEAHLAESGEHDDCFQAYARAHETAAQLVHALPPARPGADLWQRIDTKLGGVAAIAPPPRARRVWFLASAAAVAILIIVVGVTLTKLSKLRNERDAFQMALNAQTLVAAQAHDAAEAATRTAQETARDGIACLKRIATIQDDLAQQRDALTLLEKPGTRIVPLMPQGAEDVHASALLSADGNRAMVVSSGLPIRPGSDLELWVIRGKNPPRAAGFLRTRPDGTAYGEIDRAALAEGIPDAFAVSVEPLGGRPTPSEVILVGALKS
jgi:anti-sigma-K factor RskA